VSVRTAVLAGRASRCRRELQVGARAGELVKMVGKPYAAVEEDADPAARTRN
jgi:hypothetical protein